MNTNFIWIGARKTTHWSSPEQDLFGIIKLLENKEKNEENYEINLFCLDEYVYEFYYFFYFNKKNTFIYHDGFSRLKINVSILIIGVNVFINEIIKFHPEYTKIRLIFNFLREKSFLSEFHFITYRVILKDFLSLIASYFIGGYTIDTNVYPENNNNISLKSHKKLKFIKLKNGANSAFYYVRTSYTQSTNVSIATMVLANARKGRMLYASEVDPSIMKDYVSFADLFDCWLLFSPKHDELTKFALEYYLNEFSVTVTENNLYGNLIISSLANAIYQLGEEEMLDDNNYFISTQEANSALAFVPELNLVKKYQNTHKIK